MTPEVLVKLTETSGLSLGPAFVSMLPCCTSTQLALPCYSGHSYSILHYFEVVS